VTCRLTRQASQNKKDSVLFQSDEMACSTARFRRPQQTQLAWIHFEVLHFCRLCVYIHLNTRTVINMTSHTHRATRAEDITVKTAGVRADSLLFLP